MKKNNTQKVFGFFQSQPVVLCFLLGFLVAYSLFFVRPIFLNKDKTMNFPQYIPIINPIGVDLKQMLSYSESWFIAKQTPYIGANLYPPFTTVFFYPLLIIDFSTSYKIITIINIISYIFITLLIPLIFCKMQKGQFSLIILLFLSGLYSYGFQFELERGQFNVISYLFCLLAIYLYHYHHRFRYFAYILFSLSIQLKLYPAIFIIMFINDWTNWKSNLKRIAGIAVFNFVLLFILGYQTFIDFLGALKVQLITPYIWIGNHSIKSFTFLITNSHLWSCVVQFSLFSIVALCILIIIFLAIKQKSTGLNPILLLACTVGALVIPSVSNDYTLSILTAPIAITLCTISQNKNSRIDLFSTFIILGIFISYSSILFSFTNKPFLLQNNLPMLIIILLLLTILTILRNFKFNSRSESYI